MVNIVQPYKKEKKFPTERRRYSYTPPDSVVIVARPDKTKAPSITIKPAMIQAAMIYRSLISIADIGAIFLNTPEPIMIPATNKIPVGKPSTRLSGIFVLSMFEPAAMNHSLVSCLFLIPGLLAIFMLKSFK
jgi:hypothetical protein